MIVEYSITDMGGTVTSRVSLPATTGFRLILRNFFAEVNNGHTWHDGRIAVDVHGVDGDLDAYETHALEWPGYMKGKISNKTGWDVASFTVYGMEDGPVLCFLASWGRLYGAVVINNEEGESP